MQAVRIRFGRRFFGFPLGKSKFALSNIFISCYNMEKNPADKKHRSYGVNDMADKIQNAYEASKNIYDDVLTQGNFFSRMYIRLFWSGTDDNAIARKVLAYIPDDFSGALLDVPVGTAVFTQRKWASLKDARITCLDYSADMLEQAEKRLNGQAHIRCV